MARPRDGVRRAAVVTAMLLVAPAAARMRVGDVVARRAESPHPYAAGGPGRPAVWAVTLGRPGATFLKVHFAQVAIAGRARGGEPEGDYVELADAAGVRRAIVTGVHPDGLWAPAIPGETITVSIHADARDELDGVAIDRYGYGTGDLPQPRSVCGLDERVPLCQVAALERVRLTDPVARLLVAGDCGGMFLCTGFLVGADGKLMTNAHCVDSAAEASSVEAWFNWVDDTTAAGPCSHPERPNPDVFRHGELLAADCARDVAVLRFRDHAAGNPAAVYGTLPFAARAPIAGEPVWVPQHAFGERRTVAQAASVVSPAGEGFDACSDPEKLCPASGAPTGLFTDFTHDADTQSGASGSPVLDERNQVVGMHHMGGCGSGTGANAAVRADAVAPIVAALPTLQLDKLVVSRGVMGALRLRGTLDSASALDPAASPLTLRLADDDGVVFEQTVAPGAVARRRPGARWTVDAPAPGITRVVVSTGNGYRYRTRITARDIDTTAADAPVIDLTITLGGATFVAPDAPCVDRVGRKTCTLR